MKKDVTVAELTDLVQQLPEAKLTTAYTLLSELMAGETELSHRPLEERMQALAQQGADEERYFEEDTAEDEAWRREPPVF